MTSANKDAVVLDTSNSHPPYFSIFPKVKRSAYVIVDLDAITHNVALLRGCCENSHAGVIGVVKAGAYGHGSVHVSRRLKATGVERLAVATVGEAIHLRDHDISGPIHMFGNAQTLEIGTCLKYNVTPTVCSSSAIVEMASALEEEELRHHTVDDKTTLPRGSVNIKLDSGMSRNGCQPDELRQLIQCCEDLSVPIDAVFTHFADSDGDAEFTRQQLDVFLDAVEPFRSKNIYFHVANSGAILNGIGTDLDFIRPGIAMYGLPPGDVAHFRSRGFQPAASIKAIPSLVKRLPEGRKVGYGCTYTTWEGEWVATIPLGYADGYWRHLSSKGFVVRDRTGEKCPVVGRVSMDAITIKLPCSPEEDETFTVMTADFDPDTSAAGIASKVDTIPYEVVTRLSTRYSRVYIADKSWTIASGCNRDVY